ncbi:MAG: folate-binding protein YgfZ [Puniceicoccaceae bacterium]
MASAKAYRFTPRAVLRFTGEDHFDFLQGQGTADLRGPAGTCRYSLWLDHRGQIQGDGFVFRESEESMLLVSHATPVENLLAKFERHIIADDVEIENLTGEFDILALTGEDANSLLQSMGWDPVESGRYAEKDTISAYAGRYFGTRSVEFLLPTGSDLSVPADSIDPDEAEALRIHAGIPSVPLDTSTKELNPLEANILSALSFDKGCYLGQEVVARVHRLDRVTRRLVQFETSGNRASLPDNWVLEDNIVGAPTSVVENPDKCIGIGWLKSRCEDGQWTFGETTFLVQSLPAS